MAIHCSSASSQPAEPSSMRPLFILHLAVVLFAASAEGGSVIFHDSVVKINKTSAPDCFPRAWVRAEDLRPGREVRAEARLKMEGEGCRGLEKWQVGIRAKERAIFKFHAANATLPERPVMEPDFLPDDPQDGFVPGDIFSSHRMRGKFETYHREMQEYKAQLTSKSLWVSRSAIRDVFDSSLHLALSGTEDDTYHDDTSSTYLRSFRVNIPPTNFPYTLSSRPGFSFGKEKDVSSVEEMFEFYFLLTFIDGTVVDVPAGRSAFVPASTEEQVAQAKVSSSVVRPVHLRIPKAEAQPFLMAPKETPNCEDGLVSDFKVDIEIPHDGKLAAGTTHLLNVTIEQQGNSTEVPVKVSVIVRPCKRDTWAATYAFDEQHKARTTTCDNGIVAPEGEHFRSTSFHFNGPEESVLMTKYASGYDDSREDGADTRHMGVIHEEYLGPWHHGSADIADNSQRLTTLLVELTIPDDIAFTYNRTLQNVENRLSINIVTEFTCERIEPIPLGGSKVPGPKAELTDDKLWSPRWRLSDSSSRHNMARKKRSVNGNAKVDILPPAKSLWTSRSPLIDYKDPKAKAIVLSALDAPSLQGADYPHVNTLIVESEQDRQRSKFDIWYRLPSCKDGKTRGDCPSGLADGLAGELWARYQWRKAQSAGLQEEEEVRVPALTADSGQVLLQ